jgi:GTP cyclohydrolase I
LTTTVSPHVDRSHRQDRNCATRFRPAGVDQPRLEAAVREILLAVGEDPDREGLLDTPRRVARAYVEMFAGLHDNAARHLARRFDHEGGDDPVVLRNIEFASTCEHHLQPFLGRAHLAYLPAGGQVTGLSKLARTVDVFARRPQLQERLTAQIADALHGDLGARGAAVIIEGEHLCMRVRGVRKRDAVMITTASRGVYAEDPARRREIFALLRDAA